MKGRSAGCVSRLNPTSFNFPITSSNTSLFPPNSGSFENSYIPENPRTPKPLTFSKNRLRGSKNRSNTSPIAKKFSEKTIFFFKNFVYVKKNCTCACFKVLLKKFEKKRKKKKVAHRQKKSCKYAKVDKKYRFFGFFFQRIITVMNVLEGPEVGFWKEITLGSFENSYIPENPRTPKPLTFLKNRFRGLKIAQKQARYFSVFKTKQKNVLMCNFFFAHMQSFEKKSFFWQNIFATGLVFERFLASRSRFFEKVNGLGITGGVSAESRSFENSYIPENPRTLKPLTFSKNRLRGAKNRSILSPVAKKNFRKNKFFFSKTLHMGKFFLFFCLNARFKFLFQKRLKTRNFFEFFYRSLYNTYLKANFNYYERFGESRSRFFERNNGLGDIGNWGSSRYTANKLCPKQESAAFGSKDPQRELHILQQQ
ncbi:hypothetical protein LXL04_034575 [Taraxacum kok-saghyz]